jgi:beta-glucuronidase
VIRIAIGAVLLAAAIAAVVLVLGGGSGSRSPFPVPAERTLSSDGPNGRYLLDSGWSTRPDPRNIGLAEGWQQRGAAGFSHVAIPNAFNATNLTRAGFKARVQWYRTRFRAPRVPGTTAWNVRFEAVGGRADVFLNGRRVGGNSLPFLPFEVRAGTLSGGTNDLVVRVDARPGRMPLPPAGRPAGWWNYGGLLREVYLRRVGLVDLSDLLVSATPGQPSPVRVSAIARNTTRRTLRLPITVDVTGPDGYRRSFSEGGRALEPGAAMRVAASFDIPHPMLWGPGHPALYLLRVGVPGGQVTQVHFGIRRWSVDGHGRLLLNGRPLPLRGASFHEETAAHGGALTAADRAQIVRQLQALGANIAREHYPPHPALLEAFDRAGIVFWEQLPVWRLRGSQLRARALRPTALSYLRRALLRDRNHPSVVAWSLSNETLRGGRPEVQYLREGARLVRRLAPHALVAADTPLLPSEPIPSAYARLDAVGLTSYVGWYGRSPVSRVGPLLDAVRARFPRLALLVTELGAEANRAGPAREKGTFAFQRAYLARELSIIDSRRFLSGVLVWLLRDFPVRPGWSGGNPHPHPPFNEKGLIQRDGSPKPAFAVVRQDFLRSLRAGR